MVYLLVAGFPVERGDVSNHVGIEHFPEVFVGHFEEAEDEAEESIYLLFWIGWVGGWMSYCL